MSPARVNASDIFGPDDSAPNKGTAIAASELFGGEEEKPFTWEDIWPVQLGKAVYNSAKDAATLPGDVYSGKQQTDDPSITGRALNFGLLASPTAGAGTKVPTAAAEAVAPSEKALMESGDAGYNFVRNSNVSMNGPMVGAWSKAVKGELKRKGFYDTQNNAPNTFKILDDLEANSGSGAHLTGGDYINLRQALQEHAMGFANGKDSAAATRAIKALDALWDKAPQAGFVAGTPAEVGAVRAALKDSRADFAAGLRSRMLTGKEYAADLRSAAANSGKNYDNTLRQRVAGILLSKKESAGLSADEIAKLETFVDGGTARNFTRDLSNKMGGGGGLGAAVYAIPGIVAAAQTGSLSALIAGLGIPLGGAALKAVENQLTKTDLKALDNMLRLRSSSAQRMPKSPPKEAVSAGTQATGRLLLDYLAQHPNES
jgi:hypothetical protein